MRAEEDGEKKNTQTSTFKNFSGEAFKRAKIRCRILKELYICHFIFLFFNITVFILEKFYFLVDNSIILNLNSFTHLPTVA